jgi:cytochrome P450
VMLCMGAANRDPEHFSDPEKLDLQRPARPASELNYISFGAGRHRCPGIYVAQTNFPITLRILLERLPFESLRVDYENAERCMDLQQRGYDRLPIAWSAN